jgi:hypothetical protein
MANKLYASVTNCSDISAITVSDNHSAPTAQATIQCTTCTLDVGSSVSIDLGYTTAHNTVFSGYVKSVQRSQSPTQYEITCANVMVRAVDYFIASSDPDSPYSKKNITAEAVIGDLMAMAGLTHYHGNTSYFTFATRGGVIEVNLVSAYDYSKFIADLIAWHIYADSTGAVYFLKRDPFPQGGDVSIATLNNSNLTDISYWRSDRDLRNRVVVYGAEDVYATAQAASAYLPAGFYKSVAVAAPTVIDTNTMAQLSADYNLALLNRLTVGGSATIIGDSTITCRSCVTVDKSDIAMTGLFYVYGCEHSWSKDGYKTQMELRK